ncbi:MAG: hypothetical protein LUG44_06920 [Clostridiales bacterium]|nr:hypothetical protein [Clostridiales bacterium]
MDMNKYSKRGAIGLNKEEVDAIFDAEAILLNDYNVVPVVVAARIFGEEAVVSALRPEDAGRKWNATGSGLMYLYRKGIYQAASHCNRLACEEHEKISTVTSKSIRETKTETKTATKKPRRKPTDKLQQE